LSKNNNNKINPNEWRLYKENKNASSYIVYSADLSLTRVFLDRKELLLSASLVCGAGWLNQNRFYYYIRRRRRKY
jgi:hypothetical protein